MSNYIFSPSKLKSLDYYQILQIDRKADPEIIKKAYLTIIKDLHAHPDLGGNNEAAVIINQAYHVLMNPERRNEYDKQLKSHEISSIRKLLQIELSDIRRAVNCTKVKKENRNFLLLLCLFLFLTAFSICISFSTRCQICIFNAYLTCKAEIAYYYIKYSVHSRVELTKFYSNDGNVITGKKVCETQTYFVIETYQKNGIKSFIKIPKDKIIRIGVEYCDTAEVKARQEKKLILSNKRAYNTENQALKNQDEYEEPIANILKHKEMHNQSVSKILKAISDMKGEARN